jgi:hypothetical protein
MWFHNIGPVDSHRAASSADEAADDSQESGLTAAARAKQADQGPRLQVEGYIVDRDQVALVRPPKTLSDIAELTKRLGGRLRGHLPPRFVVKVRSLRCVHITA